MLPLAAPATEPAKPNHTTRSSNQTRSRSQEPENGHAYSAHQRRSQIIATDPPAILSRHTHALRSPKTHRTLPTQTSAGRVIRRGAPPPPAVPKQTPPTKAQARTDDTSRGLKKACTIGLLGDRDVWPSRGERACEGSAQSGAI